MDTEWHHQIQHLRDTMIRQDGMFKQQVRELHRVYEKQRHLMNQLKRGARSPELGTRDFLHTLDLQQQQQQRVKRRKSLDLEQPPAADGNDEEEEQQEQQQQQHWDCELYSSSQTLSLFPIPSSSTRGSSSPSPSAFTGPDSEKSRMRFCQAFNQGVDHMSTMRYPWKCLGQDGARLIGQIVREYQLEAAPCTVNKSSSSPWGPSYSFNRKDAYTEPPSFPALNGVLNNTASLKTSTTSSCKLPVCAPVFNFTTEDAGPKLKVAAAHVEDMLHRNKNNKTEVTKAAEMEKSDTFTTNRSFTITATTRYTDGDTSRGVESFAVVDLNKDCCSEAVVVDELLNDNTTTLAATILLSLAPDSHKCYPSSYMSKCVQDSSSLLPSDVKLFKSVVIMLKKQSAGGKASKKLVVKSESCGGSGSNEEGKKAAAAAAAATLFETLGRGGVRSQEIVAEEEKPNDSVHASGKNKSFPAQQPAWLWGDVTRRKRMQRHRNNSNHPQQVRQVRCLN